MFWAQIKHSNLIPISNMADDNCDPTRWSHWFGEAREVQEYIEKASTFVFDDARIGIRGNAADLAMVTWSDSDGQRGRKQKKEERETKERGEAAKDEKEKEGKGKENK